MSTHISNTTNGLRMTLAAYSNCDDVELFWRVAQGDTSDAIVAGLRGFMIERQRLRSDGSWSEVEVLRNRTGFDDHPAVDPESNDEAPSMPSDIWPFQCFEWTDHGATSGGSVRYRVSATVLGPGAQLGQSKLTPLADSGWTSPIEVRADAGNGVAAYFNRGTVMSQFVARIARTKNWGPKDIKNHVKELEEPLRRFLSGELRLALLALLDQAINDIHLEIYAALYELSDAELIDRLKLLAGRAHVLLSNGSDKSGDENASARDELQQAGVDVHDRMLASKGLGHNKFVVLARLQHDKSAKAIKVLTGSTNWTPSGLCTQLNNAISFDHDEIATHFLDQWFRLSDAGNAFPSELVQSNAASPRNVGDTAIWFTRVRNKSPKNEGLGSDLGALIEAVRGARHTVLYVMFQPGPEPLKTIVELKSKLYVRGVVSTLTAQNVENFELSGLPQKSYQQVLVQPEGIGKDFGWWVKEITRAQFTYPHQNPGIGHAITHAKMIVIDPLSNDCVVITGSHNFSGAASEQNDENFVVVKGNRALAEAYSVACLATYRHYRWRAYVTDMLKQGRNPWSHLSASPDWESSYLNPERRAHIAMWCPP